MNVKRESAPSTTPVTGTVLGGISGMVGVDSPARAGLVLLCSGIKFVIAPFFIENTIGRGWPACYGVKPYHPEAGTGLMELN